MTMLWDGALVFIYNWRLTMGMLVFFAIVLFPIRPRFKTSRQPAFTSTGIFLALFVIFLLLLRLAFISKALFPSYFDSAQHYSLIKNILSDNAAQILQLLRTNYYHLGFHFLAAFFTFVFQSEITTTMLLLGQITLTLIPLPIFFIVKSITDSNGAGAFAMTLSAFGWYMPAHAVDWGKYPALMSIWLICYSLGLILLIQQSNFKIRLLYGLLTLAVILSIFVHSRALIVFGIIVFSWIVSSWWGRTSRSLQKITFISLIAIVLLEAAVVQRHDVLSLLLDPYLNQGLLNMLLVVLLSVFAYRSYPRLTFTILLTIGLLLVSVFIPVNGLFRSRPYLTLLDRPYVEMLLFMPLSLLGGLGLAGLDRVVKDRYKKYTVGVVISLVLIFTFLRHNFYPSECCVILGNDDVVAMAWMADQIPVEARIGVASTELRVVAENIAESAVGSDAGVWITPLIERWTVLLPYDSRFDEEETLAGLCQDQIEYLFVGELGQPFDRARLDFRPGWYRLLLTIPRTKVYEVIGCKL